MEWQVTNDPIAQDEILEALNYYESKSHKAADGFMNEVSDGIEALKRNPFFEIRYKFIRCLPLNKFPFMLHFHVDEEANTVLILGVIHTSLNPDKLWR